MVESASDPFLYSKKKIQTLHKSALYFKNLLHRLQIPTAIEVTIAFRISNFLSSVVKDSFS